MHIAHKNAIGIKGTKKKKIGEDLMEERPSRDTRSKGGGAYGWPVFNGWSYRGGFSSLHVYCFSISYKWIYTRVSIDTAAFHCHVFFRSWIIKSAWHRFRFLRAVEHSVGMPLVIRKKMASSWKWNKSDLPKMMVEYSGCFLLCYFSLFIGTPSTINRISMYNKTWYCYLQPW